MTEILLKHRTIRKYLAKDIPQVTLNQVLEAGCRASTTGNMQVYSIIVSRETKMKELLSGCHFNQPMVKNAPVVLTFCADFNRFNIWCEQNNADPGYDNFLSFFTSHFDYCLLILEVRVGI